MRNTLDGDSGSHLRLVSKYVLVVLCFSFVLILQGCGVTKAVSSYSAEGTGTLVGHVTSVGSDSVENGDEPAVVTRVFTLRHGMVLFPKESDFLFDGSTELVVDGRVVVNATAGRLTKTLSGLGDDAKVAVSYSESSTASVSAETPEQDYRYAAATKIVVESK